MEAISKSELIFPKSIGAVLGANQTNLPIVVKDGLYLRALI